MSTPPRLLCAELPPSPGRVRLGAEAAKHARVLRLREGDAVLLFDGRGHEADAHVVRATAGALEVQTEGSRDAAPALFGRLVLVQAWAKADKMESIVRATTELGVSEVRAVTSERVVARSPAERRERRFDRLQRVAEEAARQSGRADVPTLLDGGTLEQALAAAPSGALRLLAHAGASRALPDVPTPAGTSEVWLAVGPEGGFAPAEVEAAARLGWLEIRLAPYVLRVETAAPIAVGLSIGRLWTRVAGAERP